MFIANYTSRHMLNAYKLADARSVCIICDERVGTIQTVDGMVCPCCMPKEPLPQARLLRKHRMIHITRPTRIGDSVPECPNIRKRPA